MATRKNVQPVACLVGQFPTQCQVLLIRRRFVSAITTEILALAKSADRFDFKDFLMGLLSPLASEAALDERRIKNVHPHAS